MKVTGVVGITLILKNNDKKQKRKFKWKLLKKK